MRARHGRTRRGLIGDQRRSARVATRPGWAPPAPALGVRAQGRQVRARRRTRTGPGGIGPGVRRGGRRWSWRTSPLGRAAGPSVEQWQAAFPPESRAYAWSILKVELRTLQGPHLDWWPREKLRWETDAGANMATWGGWVGERAGWRELGVEPSLIVRVRGQRTDE